ncbi:SKA2 domain-containing protein [Caenorhabditis elegans]|uniref:SKA2 domain-containing protein n=1 Tax=Caenorhabditis elegans TaxID=6239 RepID=P91051_CAEEL|nr:SKA2 domain-containing protein [Caenorhabditis elegans]CCD64702.1 SKA2 domain-containing protein [Caenorhabditis elegans]|eukprot:NP_494547.2 Uncharacterized protein CELE_C16C8.12 [Caenorhabditis elegans]
MSEPNNLMSEFQKLCAETSRIQNEFREIPSSAGNALLKDTQEMCQKILKKQDELHDEMKHVQESLMSELNSVKNELKHAKSINDLIAKNADKNLETLLKIQKTQDQIMMKLLEGDAMEKMGGLVLKNIPDEPEKPEKPEKPENENFSLNISPAAWRVDCLHHRQTLPASGSRIGYNSYY